MEGRCQYFPSSAKTQLVFDLGRQSARQILLISSIFIGLIILHNLVTTIERHQVQRTLSERRGGSEKESPNSCRAPKSTEIVTHRQNIVWVVRMSLLPSVAGWVDERRAPLARVLYPSMPRAVAFILCCTRSPVGRPFNNNQRREGNKKKVTALSTAHRGGVDRHRVFMYIGGGGHLYFLLRWLKCREKQQEADCPCRIKLNGKFNFKRS